MAEGNNTIWQWNCRGFKSKRAVLQSYLTGADKTDVIALQECGKNAKLAHYKSSQGTKEGTQVAILTKRNITILQHELGQSQLDYVAIEIIPLKRKGKSFFVMNVYSPPRQRKDCGFDELFAKFREVAQQNPCLIMGHFNAHHAAWGYKHTQVKGRNLWQSIQQNNLILLTDPLEPTRQGNSVTQDSTPDLTLLGGRRLPHGATPERT